MKQHITQAQLDELMTLPKGKEFAAFNKVHGYIYSNPTVGQLLHFVGKQQALALFIDYFWQFGTVVPLEELCDKLFEEAKKKLA